MTSNEFCKWLSELIANSDTPNITPYQSSLIKKRLGEVNGTAPQINGNMPEYYDLAQRHEKSTRYEDVQQLNSRSLGIPSNEGLMGILQAMQQVESNYTPNTEALKQALSPAPPQVMSSETYAQMLAEGNEIHEEQYLKLLQDILKNPEAQESFNQKELKEARAKIFDTDLNIAGVADLVMLENDNMLTPESQQIKNNRAAMKVVYL